MKKGLTERYPCSVCSKLNRRYHLYGNIILFDVKALTTLGGGFCYFSFPSKLVKKDGRIDNDETGQGGASKHSAGSGLDKLQVIGKRTSAATAGGRSHTHLTLHFVLFG